MIFTIEEYAIAANDVYRDRPISAHMANIISALKYNPKVASLLV